eukprot:TRINITY_DN42_c0_g4_i5.p1 TRINITY_DN42_c0_g4~~TRINITY_DN42_c0_g4_i5.p1  ORF type:complete len:808 (-),score=191.67 TRINITY_DN42_c0_g4_i5:236-2659(-)
MYKLGIVYLLCVVVGIALAGDLLPINTYPQWDLCVNGGDFFSCSGHGSCSGGQCVCRDGFTGRDCSLPPGGFTYSRPTATVTYFCTLASGGCAPGMCIGGGDFTADNLPDGIDGICALNPTIYGSRYAYANGQFAIPRTLNGQYTFVGQSCGTCWRLTKGSVSVTVTVVDRCAGYCRANAAGTCDANAFNVQESECGNCINGGHSSVPVCSCYSPNATNASPKGFCNSNQAINCDWCSNNDHPHFDLDDVTYNKLCGADGAAGHCDLDSFQMISCGMFKGPWPNGYFNGTDAAPSSGTVSSSSGDAGTTDGGGNSGGNGGDGVCTQANEGDFMCNGCELMRCANGNLVSYGACSGGLVCTHGACDWGTTCDPVWNGTIAQGSDTTGSSTTGGSGTTANSGLTNTGTSGNTGVSTHGATGLDSIIALWYCGDDGCTWESEPNLNSADWILNRGDGYPTANVVIFAFIDPYKLLQQTSDWAYNNGIPKGFTYNTVNYFKNQGITVFFSIGGESYTESWNQALSADPATLAHRAADLATTYGVGIEIDYEDDYDTPDYATAMDTFVNTYRSLIPYDPNLSVSSLLTIDTGAGTGYLATVSTWATTWVQQNKINWINAMVGSGPWDTITDASQYWQQHITAGIPSTQMLVSHYSSDGSTLCATYPGLLADTMSWIETNHVRGVAFWAVGSGQASNCAGIKAASEAYLSWTSVNGTQGSTATTGGSQGQGTSTSSSTSASSTTGSPPQQISSSTTTISTGDQQTPKLSGTTTVDSSTSNSSLATSGGSTCMLLLIYFVYFIVCKSLKCFGEN